MEPCFIVICRDDDKSDGTPGEYVLATRRTFAARSEGDTYASGIAQGRAPIVVECPQGLIYPSYNPARPLREGDELAPGVVIESISVQHPRVNEIGRQNQILGGDHERLSGTLEIETKHGHRFRVTQDVAPQLFIAWATWTAAQAACTATRIEWNPVLDAADQYLNLIGLVIPNESDSTADVRAFNATPTPANRPVKLPRAWTEEEARDKFLKLWASYVRYWLDEAREQTAKGKLEGLAFSLLVILDGGSAALPGFVVAPNPHKDDRAFCITQGQNYYPEGPTVECDIAGSLHDHIHEYLRKV